MPSNNPRLSLAIGLAAVFVTVAITVGWQIATRAGMTTALGPLDLAVLRYGIPTLLLAPVWWRHGLLPRSVDRRTMAALVIGGWPYGLVAMSGAIFAPVAHMGALVPGTMPLMVALLAALLFGERIPPARMLGFAIIVAGVALLSLPSFAATRDGAWKGQLLFLAAAALWAVHTVAFRRIGISALHAASLIAFWSAAFVLPCWLIAGPGRLLALDPRMLAVQALWQGVLAGTIAVFTYGVAIRHLGASNAALSGAFVPGAVALGGYLVLGERLDPPTLLGILVVTLGVWLASGLAGRIRSPAAGAAGSRSTP